MSWTPPQIDATHDMYQPAKRGPRLVPRVLVPNRDGSHAEKEAWMRDHLKRLRQPNAVRRTPTAQPNSPLTVLIQRQIARCEEEIRLCRLLPEDPTQKAYLPAMGEADWHAEKRRLEKGD